MVAEHVPGLLAADLDEGLLGAEAFSTRAEMEKEMACCLVIRISWANSKVRALASVMVMSLVGTSYSVASAGRDVNAHSLRTS